MTFFRHSPCEHGYTGYHRWEPIGGSGHCTGGSIAPLTVDDLNLEAAAEALHVQYCNEECRWPGMGYWIESVRHILAAALTTEDSQ